MSAKALALLDQLLGLIDEEGKEKKTNRLLTLLRPLEGELHTDWFMCVPACFNEALDICQTARMVDKVPMMAWTQGSWFYFKSGDVLYDTQEGYANWSQALKRFNYCIQVNEATQAAPATKSSKRISGTVHFTTFVPNTEKSGLMTKGSYSLTQDEFLRLLIVGGSCGLE